MNSKGIVIAVVAILAIGAIGVFALTTGGNDDDGDEYVVNFKDSFEREIKLTSVPDRVAVVNTDLAYMMQILGLEDKVIGMDTDGLEGIKGESTKFNDVKDIGKRSAFPGSTALEKMMINDIDCVITPTTMGIGTTVSADAIEDKGITVVYLNAYGADMLSNLDKLVLLFGGDQTIKDRAEEYKTLYNTYIDMAKGIVDGATITDKFLIYMSSSSGGLGNYYHNSSEISGIVTSIGGTNAVDIHTGSFSQIKGETLYSKYYDGTTPKIDVVFFRGTDSYDMGFVKDVFDDQALTSNYTVGEYVTDNDVDVVYINTHIASGFMSCFSNLVYAYTFTDSLDQNNIDYITEKTNEFMNGYGFTFKVEEDHPVVSVMSY